MSAAVTLKPSKRLGGVYLGEERCRFRVWAPLPTLVELHIVSPEERVVELEPRPLGYFQAVVDGVEPGTRYFYCLDGKVERPDPASEFQPEGVHGPSEVVDQSFLWSDENWRGLALDDLIIYELHVGTFSKDGTFEGVVEHLEELKELGITAIELMPVAQFPGGRNWGYDGVYPFAVQNTYGGPWELKRLVDACHRKGLAVILDVVYNHLGPEGNYLADFGPYFTDKYKCPWGPAVNFDGPGSDEVRRFFVENALYWITQFHLDGLRVDAIHGITDFSARPFLEELTRRVHRRGQMLRRKVYVIAESDLNDSRAVTPRELGGFGFDAQWNDDFHHALHALLTGERDGYYADFGGLRHIAKSLREGFVYQGQYSRYRQRRHGNQSRDISPRHFIVFSQNHDQVGNRMFGERLAALVSLEGLKLAAGVVILSPFMPLLFMGEEYGETAPFLYFTSHGEPNLVEAVRRGRSEEFSTFRWRGTPPDPQDETTFLRCKLRRSLRCHGHHRALWDFYRALIALRKEILGEENFVVWEVKEVVRDRVLLVKSSVSGRVVARIYHFGKDVSEAEVPLGGGLWHKRIDSWDTEWVGPGSPLPSHIHWQGELPLALPPEGFMVLETVLEYDKP